MKTPLCSSIKRKPQFSVHCHDRPVDRVERDSIDCTYWSNLELRVDCLCVGAAGIEVQIEVFALSCYFNHCLINIVHCNNIDKGIRRIHERDYSEKAKEAAEEEEECTTSQTSVHGWFHCY